MMLKRMADKMIAWAWHRAHDRQQRGFDAAKIGRLLNDWIVGQSHINDDISSSLSILRNRSRDLCMNNDYGKKFLNLISINVVGPDGFKLQSRAKLEDGKTVDSDAAVKIEKGWKDWCKKGVCSMDRRYSFVDVCRIVAKSVPRDGEMFVRKVAGAGANTFGFGLQLIRPDFLDHTYFDTRQRIVMGVQMNEWNAPAMYHFLKDRVMSDRYGTGPRQPIPAPEIIHAYIADEVDQVRGVPWTVTAMRRLHMLGKYEESEMVAARVAAAKMGFIISPDGEFTGDDEEADGTMVSSVSPGKIEQLPSGYDFKEYDPAHPNTGFDAFVKAVLRGAASGLCVSYVSLANNLEGVSYSSIRQGVLEDRDMYRILQGWMIETLIQPVFEEWLRMAMSRGALDLPMSGYERFRDVTWIGRRWSWVDPRADMDAHEKAIALGLTSRTRVSAEMGNDFDDVTDELKTERETAAEKGISITPQKTTAKAGGVEDGKEDKQE